MAAKRRAAKRNPDNPLDAYATGIVALQWLAEKSESDEIRLEAARILLDHTSVPPTVGWDFEEAVE